MPINKSILERLKNVRSDVALARFLRSGCNDLKLQNIKVKDLREWLTGSSRKLLYHSFTIKKRSGASREIKAPHYDLKLAQRILAQAFNQAYSPRIAAHGYIKGRSIKTNAHIHQNQRWVLRIDLEDFFPSIHFGRVRGLLTKPPFDLSDPVAEMIAILCTFPKSRYNNVLPQGAPTSPVLSNLICRTLDRDLMQVAKRYRCYYSRYADDLVFSTDRNNFPSDLVFVDGDAVKVGEALYAVIKKHDFNVNASKILLKNKQARQIVTGLVVNEKVNVPRYKIRETRAMLHSWQQHGEEVAAQQFLEKFDKKNRPDGLYPPQFKQVVRGRVQYIGSIKGWGDPVYLKLAKKLSEVDSDFTFDYRRVRIKDNKIVLFTEGITDRMHVRAALNHFHSISRYENLNLEFHEDTSINGDDDLMRACKAYADRPQPELYVFLFDRDNNRVIQKVKGSTTLSKDWGNNVFSLILPLPSFRTDPICIEHYYEDKTIRKKNSEGRSLYLKSDFDDRTGRHKEGKVYRSKPKNSLIIDSDVYNLRTGRSMALSKNEFAKLILEKEPPFKSVNFDSFTLLFDELIKIIETFDT